MKINTDIFTFQPKLVLLVCYSKTNYVLNFVCVVENKTNQSIYLQLEVHTGTYVSVARFSANKGRSKASRGVSSVPYTPSFSFRSFKLPRLRSILLIDTKHRSSLWIKAQNSYLLRRSVTEQLGRFYFNGLHRAQLLICFCIV